MKTVILSGISGMDSANMLDFLLAETDCKIVGIVRHLSNNNWENFRHNIGNERFVLEEADLTDAISIHDLVLKYKPEYFINFGGSSFVGNSWSQPVVHLNTNALGVLYCLEAIKKCSPSTRFYNAGSSEQFGNVDYSPQDILHPFKPRSPYGVSKSTAHFLVKTYRESYGMYAIQGILFNHEGLRRNEVFLTRKVTKGVARINQAISESKCFDPIELGNIYAKRDWSDSEDFVKGVWLMINQKEPKDYVLSSDETHTVKEFVELAFEAAGINGEWTGEGVNEKFIVPNYVNDVSDIRSQVLVSINPEFYRPNEVDLLWGCSKPAREELGWKPEISFPQLVKRMTLHDIAATKSSTP